MTDYIVVIIVLIASAFFSGLEFAFISANKLKVELTKQQGGLLGKVLSIYFDKPSRFLGTTLLGNNIAIAIYGFAMAALLQTWLPEDLAISEFSTLLLTTLISTLIILFVGEFLPKSLFRLNPNGVLNVVAIPFLLIYIILWIPMYIIVFMAQILLKIFFGIDYQEEDKTVLGKVDLQHYLQQNIGNTTREGNEPNEQIDTSLFEKALDLTHIKARECMIPRTEIQAIDYEEEWKVVKQKFITTKHSKIVVYQNDIDHIIGYFHHQDVLQRKRRLWKMLVVPETMPAANLLNTFIRERKSIAWVVDEFGGTAGIVTLEDIIEEIFGEIRDEHDDESFLEQRVADNEYIFSARLEIDYLNEKYQLNIPEGEYETLAGYIIHKYESIPHKGEEIQIGAFAFAILEAKSTRIETIKIKITD